jgi:hypothetical protein
LCLLEERVEELRERETAEFGEAFRASVLAEPEREPIPGLWVPVDVRVELDDIVMTPGEGFRCFAVRLFEAAWLSTPLPARGFGSWTTRRGPRWLGSSVRPVGCRTSACDASTLRRGDGATARR